MGVGDALRWSLRYFGRFFRLGLLVLAATAPLIALFMLAVSRSVQSTQQGGDFPLGLGLLLAAAAITLLVDFALTFVTPALVYSTDSAIDAARIGLRLLRETWPHAAPYVLLPPLAVVALTRLSSGPVELLGGIIITSTALLSLLARGATASLYLRLMPTAGPEGALSERREPSHSMYGGT